MKKSYTSGDVSRLVGAAPRTVCKWIDGGKLKGFRLPSATDNRSLERRVVLREDLIVFLRDNGMTVPAELGGPPVPTLLCVGLGDDLFARMQAAAGSRLLVTRRFGLFSAGVALADLRPHAVLFDLACGRSDCLKAATVIRSGKNAPKVYAVLCDGDDPAELSGEFDGLLVSRNDAAKALEMVFAGMGEE